jgi:hypothetical protein
VTAHSREEKVLTTLISDSHTYNGLKVRFSAKVGEEPEIEVRLV